MDKFSPFETSEILVEIKKNIKSFRRISEGVKKT